MSRQLRSASKRSIKTTAKTQTPPVVPAVPAVPVASTSLDSQLFDDSTAWETWLQTNHDSHTGLWLRLSKKNSGLASVTYDEALNAALCYGWIDGQKKSYDDKCFLQRFTPRRKASIWSKRNVNKVAELIASGRMRPPGQTEIDAAKADGRWERAYSGSSTAEVPPDFQAAMDADGHAAEFFKAINRSQRYSFLFRLETAKRPDTRQKRIEQFVKLLADEKCL
jgi:uncharacterized protein YdeI (YjbR/CyaY-like superfamily)